MINIWQRGQPVRKARRFPNPEQHRYWRRNDKHHFYAQLNPEQQGEWKKARDKQQGEYEKARDGKVVNADMGEGRLGLFRLLPDGNQAYCLRSPRPETATGLRLHWQRPRRNMVQGMMLRSVRWSRRQSTLRHQALRRSSRRRTRVQSLSRPWRRYRLCHCGARGDGIARRSRGGEAGRKGTRGD